MHVLKMTSQISTLSKSFLAERAFKRTETCVFSKMVSQVAALLKGTATVRILAFEIELHSLGVRVLNSNCLMPLFRYALKSLVFIPS